MRLALACAAALLAATAASAAGAPATRVLLALAPPASTPGAELAALRGAGVDELGLMTASVGSYSEHQTLLDITQGARVLGVNYAPRGAPALTLGPGGLIAAWPAVTARAASAGAGLVPGALASAVPGGAGYVASTGGDGADGVLAADRRGRIAAISVASASTLLARAARMLARQRLVVVDLTNTAQLRALIAARTSRELLLVLERPASTPAGSLRPPLLLALGAAGLGGGRGTLTSGATRTGGLVEASDLAPTVLRWLDVTVPRVMSGQAIGLGPARTVAQLGAYAKRLAVIDSRRVLVLVWFALVWLALVLSALLRRRGLRAALGLGGLAALWSPVSVLAASALSPRAVIEGAIVIGGAFALARASELLLPWPRAALAPAVATLTLYGADLLAGSGLIETSLLGSDPISGSRFFGAGNELTAVLAVELLVAFAAAAPRPRRPALLLGAGVLTALALSWGRAGANVGAVFTVGGAIVGGALVLLPGAVTLGRSAVAGIALAAVLVLVVGLDLVTGGGAQLTSQVVHAHSLTAVLGTLGRRLNEAWLTLRAPPVAVAVLTVVAAVGLAVRARKRLLERVPDGDSWAACLVGALAGSLLGSFAADSGPRVLLVGAVGAACVLAYLQGEAGPWPAGESVLTRRLVGLSRLGNGSGFPRPDPPNLARR